MSTGNVIANNNKDAPVNPPDKLSPLTNGTKQVKFNPNTVTIPLSETCTTNTTSDSVTSIKGTIPIHDTTDPTKIKNVIVSVPNNNGGSDHTYAKTNDSVLSPSAKMEVDEDDDVDVSSSSDDSSSDSEDSDTETERPILSNTNKPLPSSSPSISSSGENTSTTDNSTPPKNPQPKKRGRPRKNPISATPQPAPPTKTKDTPTPRRSILKVSQSAPVTPETTGVTRMRPSNVGGTLERVRKRGRGCGTCVGCVREDCGKCPYCLDKPKYGGPGKKKQRCALRTCSQFVSVGKRVNANKTPLPDTPKSAALLSVAQTLVAAIQHTSSSSSTTNGSLTDSIPLATPIQQAPSPSPNQVETPILKIPEESFKKLVTSSSLVPPPSSIAPPTKGESVLTPTPSSTSSSPVVTTAASIKPVTLRSYSSKLFDMDDSMKCVTCARERKLKLAKSDKFCTLRCMKSWMESNPGRKPEDAEPNDKNMLFMPPTTTIAADAPRAIKKLLINMALPGTQPIGSSVPTGTSLTSSMISTLSSNLSNLLNAAAASPPTNGIKRTTPQDSPSVPLKKFKEAPVSVTSSTKTVTTPLIAKSNPKVNLTKKKGPNDLPLDVTKWGVAEVVKFFQSKSECQVFAPILKEQEIDGPALLLLSHDSLVKCLDIKLGPALKIMTHVELLKQQQASHT